MNTILGGGISGLLAGFYLEDYTKIITSEAGGQLLSSTFQLGPQFLHKTKETQKLLNDLNLKAKTKKIKVSFYFDKTLRTKCTEELREKYLKKTRNETSNSCTLREGKSFGFSAFDVNIRTIIDSLATKLSDKLICDKIVKLDINANILSSFTRKYNFEKCISTIPAPVFFKLYDNIVEFNFEYKPIIFVLAKTHSESEFSEYDYVYFTDDEFEFNRITNLENNLRVYEFPNVIAADKAKHKLLGSDSFADIYTQHIGKISNSLNLREINDIIFLGRWAKWEDGILIQDTLKQIFSMKAKKYE